MVSFSVTISLYKNDNPGHFKEAMDSILNQSFPPDEIVLTVDGPIPDVLNDIVDKYESELQNLIVIRMPENKGLGIAHQIGVDHCTKPLIAIMDSDDIAVSNRFEMQLRYFAEKPDVDIVGGYFSDFMGSIENVVGIRNVPSNDIDIKKYLKKRCPFNQSTVMFKKDSVLKSGNYKDWHFNEDYYLWCRMLLNGCTFGNIPAVLTNFRVGRDMYNRRGGWKYFKSEAKLQKFMLENKIINICEYMVNVMIRFAVQIVLQDRMRGFIYCHLFRRNNIS